MKKEHLQNICLQLIISLLGAIALEYCVNLPAASLGYSYSIWPLLIWIVWFWGLKKACAEWEAERSKRMIPCFFFALLFAGSMVTGVQLEQWGAVDFGNLWIYGAILAAAVAITPILEWAVWKLEKKNHAAIALSETLSSTAGSRFPILVWGFLFVCYTITLLSVWPGFFTYDAENEVYQVFTGKYTSHHPVMHVLLLGGILRIVKRFTDSYNMGIAAYMLLQIALVSGCFSYMLTFLKKCGVKRWVLMVSILFLGLFPTVSMFLCCSVKDVYFSAGLALFTTLLLESAKYGDIFWEKKSKKILSVLSLLLILFFRNNGIYALVLFYVIFLFLDRKWWKKWNYVFLVSLFVFITSTALVNVVFHVKKGSIAEMLSVPIQQLARTHAQARDSFSEEELAVLYHLIPESVLKDYNPELSDMVKYNFLEDNFTAEPTKYISLWFQMGVRHFDIYVNSFLMNTYGYWYPDTVLNGYGGIKLMDKAYKDSSYFSCVTELPGERVHLLPALERFYEKISLEIYQQRLPVVSMLFSVGFWYWYYLFLLLYLFLSGDRKQMLSLGVMLSVYLTVLPGPIVLVRYVLYYFFCAPLALALLLHTRAVTSEADR